MDITQLIESRVLADPAIISDFIKHLPDLGENEVYFLSLSARNKYLSTEERDYYSLGQTEMFSRQIAFDRDGIALALNRMKGDLESRRTRSGLEMPNRCLVVYINIHGMSTLKAYGAFVEEMNRHQTEVIHALLNNNAPNLTAFLRMNTRLMNHIQKATGTKEYLDVDIDAPKELAESILERLQEPLVDLGIPHLVIKTHGGYHIMLKSKELKKFKNFQLYKLISEYNIEAEAEGGEVGFNSNAMVPLPGTYQAGHLVTYKSF